MKFTDLLVILSMSLYNIFFYSSIKSCFSMYFFASTMQMNQTM